LSGGVQTAEKIAVANSTQAFASVEKLNLHSL